MGRRSGERSSDLSAPQPLGATHPQGNTLRPGRSGPGPRRRCDCLGEGSSRAVPHQTLSWPSETAGPLNYQAGEGCPSHVRACQDLNRDWLSVTYCLVFNV